MQTLSLHIAQHVTRYGVAMLAAIAVHFSVMLPSAHAQSAKPSPAASTQSIEQLLALNGAQASLQNAVAGIETQVRQQVINTLLEHNGGAPLSTQQRSAVEAIVPNLGTILRQELGWERLKPALIDLYRGRLTQTQVNRLIELNQDPAYVETMRQLQDINIQSAQLVAMRMPDIMKRVEPVLEEGLKRALTP